MINKINKNNFQQEIVNSEKLAVIDFYADWCGPCKMLSPVMEQLAAELGSQVKVCKVNIDEEEELASKFGVMSIPTVVLMKNGKIVDKFVGLQPKQVIEAKIKKAV